MANLKDIGYGVGKYLEASDASGIPDIGTNRTNLDLLNFKVATNNAYALYNFKDGMIDAYQTEAGVDTGTSTDETYDSSGKYYYSTVIGSYVINAFTSTGASTWTAPTNTTSAEVLTVAGGGGGGNHYYGGGGGAGGVVHDATYSVTPGVVYDITVGAGGAGNNDGSDSVFNVNAEGSGVTLTAEGGGKGADSTLQNGASGGSGGGASGYGIPNTGGSSSQTSPSGATGYGNAGGVSSNSGTQSGGGGGGAGAVGGSSLSSGVTGKGGAGGAGREFSTFSTYGVSGYFGGGGGGGAYPDSASSIGGAGGQGGGGTGGKDGLQAVAGTANTGGGGGGATYHDIPTGGAGGSGIVLIRSRPEAYNNMTLVSNAQTAQAVPTTGRLMIYEETSTGSTTLDTDLKGYVSRDGGTTYTQTPLTLDTTYETGKRLVSGSVDISGQPSGTNMKYKIETLNQSASKICRIHGASLLWA